MPKFPVFSRLCGLCPHPASGIRWKGKDTKLNTLSCQNRGCKLFCVYGGKILLVKSDMYNTLSNSGIDFPTSSRFLIDPKCQYAFIFLIPHRCLQQVEKKQTPYLHFTLRSPV